MRHSSHYKSTMLLLGILFLLGLYLVLVELPKVREEEEAGKDADHLFSFESRDVQSLLIRYPGEAFRLEKTEAGLWMLVEPLQTEADQREVQSFISIISNLRYSRVVEEQVTDPAEFGLLNPNIDITLKLPDRNERLYVGDDGPMPTSLYIERDSDQRVVLAQTWIKASLTRSVFEFRTKVILPVEPTRIDEIRLEFSKSSFHFRKQNDLWIIKSPSEGPADPETLKSLTTMLGNLRAQTFVDPGPAWDETQKRLKDPLLKLSLQEGTKNLTAEFFPAPETDSVYVITDPGKPIYRVAAANIDTLKPALFHYLDKHMLDFPADQVEILQIHSPDEDLTLTRESGQWQILDDNRPIRQPILLRTFAQLEKLKAYQEFPGGVTENPASIGLQPAIYEIRLLNRDRDLLASLRLGNEFKGMLYARGNTNLGTVLIDKDYLDEIPKRSELLLPDGESGTTRSLPSPP